MLTPSFLRHGLTAILTIAVALAIQASAADLMLLLFIEGVLSLGLTYHKILNTQGAIEQRELDTLASSKVNGTPVPSLDLVEPYVGQKPPKSVLNQVAKDTLIVPGMIFLLVGVFVIAVCFANILGSFSTSIFLWIALPIFVFSADILKHLEWLRSGNPARQTFVDVTDAPVKRGIITFAALWMAVVLNVFSAAAAIVALAVGKAALGWYEENKTTELI